MSEQSKKFSKKLIALAVVSAFLFQQVAWAQVTKFLPPRVQKAHGSYPQ